MRRAFAGAQVAATHQRETVAAPFVDARDLAVAVVVHDVGIVVFVVRRRDAGPGAGEQDEIVTFESGLDEQPVPAAGDRVGPPVRLVGIPEIEQVPLHATDFDAGPEAAEDFRHVVGLAERARDVRAVKLPLALLRVGEPQAPAVIVRGQQPPFKAQLELGLDVVETAFFIERIEQRLVGLGVGVRRVAAQQQVVGLMEPYVRPPRVREEAPRRVDQGCWTRRFQGGFRCRHRRGNRCGRRHGRRWRRRRRAYLHRSADFDVETGEPFDGVLNCQAPRARRFCPGDTRAGDGACQDHDQSWQAHLSPA